MPTPPHCCCRVGLCGIDGGTGTGPCGGRALGQAMAQCQNTPALGGREGGEGVLGWGVRGRNKVPGGLTSSSRRIPRSGCWWCRLRVLECSIFAPRPPPPALKEEQNHFNGAPVSVMLAGLGDGWDGPPHGLPPQPLKTIRFLPCERPAEVRAQHRSTVQACAMTPTHPFFGPAGIPLRQPLPCRMRVCCMSVCQCRTPLSWGRGAPSESRRSVALGQMFQNGHLALRFRWIGKRSIDVPTGRSCSRTVADHFHDLTRFFVVVVIAAPRPPPPPPPPGSARLLDRQHQGCIRTSDNHRRRGDIPPLTPSPPGPRFHGERK